MKVKLTEKDILEMVFQGVKKILEEGVSSEVDVNWLSSQNPNLKSELDKSRSIGSHSGEEMDYTFYDLNLYKIIGDDILQYLQQSGSKGLLDLINKHMKMRIIVEYIIDESDGGYEPRYWEFYVYDENYEKELLKNKDILKKLHNCISNYLNRHMSLIVGELPQDDYDYFRPGTGSEWEEDELERYN